MYFINLLIDFCGIAQGGLMDGGYGVINPDATLSGALPFPTSFSS